MSPYSPLPKGWVRLLRLLPPPGDKSRIECQLITCSLFDSRRTHSYEALSYVWGLEKSKEPIWIDGNELSIGANLHTALSHLRDCFVERILWIDAICINQRDNIEKGHQVESMAKIYAQASRVIVWLGEAADGSNHALEAIRRAAEEQDIDFSIYKTRQQASFAPSNRQLINSKINNVDQQAVLTLLEREWFQRIWVLQEVAAARHVLIKCGPAEIDGYAFCSGLSALSLSYEKRPHLQGLIPPIAYLIRGAVFRPKYEGDEISRQDRFSLNIRPLCELVDMYHTHKATVLLDKVYALLSMSNDDPYAAGLEPNYEAAWRDVFRKLVQFCLSDQISINTWDRAEVAVIEAKGYILGEVFSAGEDATEHDRQNQDATRRDRQYVDIAWKNAPSYVDMEEKQNYRFTFQASAKAVKEGDVICLLQGASRPMIIRLCNDFSTIIIITFPLADDLQKWSASVTTFPTDLLLVWDWNEPQRKSPGGEDYGKLISSREVANCPVAECQCLHDLDKITRLWNFGLLLNRTERYEKAIKNLRKAVEVYGTREGLGNVDKTDLDHGFWREVDEEALRIMDDLLIDNKGADMEGKYKEHGQTPLSWAAEIGYEAVVRLLVEKGASVEARDSSSGQTPLLWAAANGHEAVVRLLVEKGATIEAKDNSSGQTPLS
ncbi:heterokaryon incompatibility protein-domain-containing protein [Lasiosphaeria ovina]|uniref:Heterokaryon incompatibility protein-domain-containing protein n=1 Tax=Lasiosphaeria ovina TaxID=92902 RepID=A0AAE0KI00_9PEZI|nr:heterokaryon incompatibility protein-domain-containing protein [Lasiosphaeria ovina]